MKIWQAVGKLPGRDGLVVSGGPREPGYVEDWTREARKVQSSVRGWVPGTGRLQLWEPDA